MNAPELTGEFFICWNSTEDNPDEKRIMFWEGFDTREQAAEFIQRHHWEDCAHVEPKSLL